MRTSNTQNSQTFLWRRPRKNVHSREGSGWMRLRRGASSCLVHNLRSCYVITTAHNYRHHRVFQTTWYTFGAHHYSTMYGTNLYTTQLGIFTKNTSSNRSVMQRAGLASDGFLPARLTKLSCFVLLVIPCNFPDDLHTMTFRAAI